MKFNLTRFINLLKRDFIIHKRSILYTCLGVWGLLAFIVAVNSFTPHPGYQHGNFWFPILMCFVFLGGLTFTTLVFKEFRTPAGRLQFLSLPASNFEKVLSRWIYSLILFPIFAGLSVWLLSSFFINDNTAIYDELGRAGWKVIPIGYLVLHASTFLQTLYFNKFVPFKVMISGAVVTLLVALAGALLAFIFFGEYFPSGIENGPNENLTMSRNGQDFFINVVEPAGEFILIFLLVPFLWVVSYFKMKEKEA